MPTGYTADIAKGISFKEFVRQCARAFIPDTRDMDYDGTYPVITANTSYYEEQLDECDFELRKLLAMTAEECELAAGKAYKEELTSRTKRIEEKNALREKYQVMLDKVRQWTPPTNRHLEFKNFMIEQIEKSIDFDCGTSYYENNPPEKLDGYGWFKREAEKLSKDFEFRVNGYLNEVQRVNFTNKWIKDLKESVK